MRAFLILASLFLVPIAPTSAAPTAARPAFDGRLMPPEKVADHVWVMRQPDRLWAAVIGNVTIIEQADGVVLIDSGGSVSDGRDVIAGVASLTSMPIKAVAITHWHNDHPFGLPAIVERYPNVRIISTSETAEFLKTETNTGVGKVDPDLAKARLERGRKNIADFEAIAADPRQSANLRDNHALEARWMKLRVEHQLENFVVLPTETFSGSLLIEDPQAPVELRFLGVGNTHGDLVAWLPRQRLVATGDLVVAPTPYGFTISTRPWLTTIAELEKLPFTTIVPGHGAVQRDRAYLETLRWSMGDIAAKAKAAAADPQITRDAATEKFDSAPHQSRFGATDDWSKKWLDGYWLAGMFATAFDEERGIAAPGK